MILTFLGLLVYGLSCGAAGIVCGETWERRKWLDYLPQRDRNMKLYGSINGADQKGELPPPTTGPVYPLKPYDPKEPRPAPPDWYTAPTPSPEQKRMAQTMTPRPSRPLYGTERGDVYEQTPYPGEPHII